MTIRSTGLPYGTSVDGTLATPSDIRSANYSVSQGTAGNQGANYIPEIFSKKMLKDFYKSTVFSEISNTDYEGEIKAQGDVVHIRRVPTIAIGDYSMGGGIYHNDGTTAVTQNISYEVPFVDADTLVIDQAKYWAFRMDYIDEMQTDLPLISEFSSNAAEQLKIAVDVDMLTYITLDANIATAMKGNSAGAISGSIDLGVDTDGNGVLIDDGTSGTTMVDMIINMNQVLDENNAPSEGRWCVLPAAFCALLKKGELRRADFTGDSTGVIRTGLIGMVDRMKIYQSNSCKAATTETEAFRIPFGTNEAVTFAAQITKTESLPIVESFGTYWRGLFVFGRKIVQPQVIGVAILKDSAT